MPYDGSVDRYRDSGYHGGIFGGFQSAWYNQLRFLNRHRPANRPGRTISYDLGYDLLEHQTYDDWWKERNPFERLSEIKVPVLSIGHWPKLGLHVRGNIVGFEEITSPKQAAHQQRPHAARRASHVRRSGFSRTHVLPFYEHHLKGVDNGVMDGAPVRIYVRGAERFPRGAAMAAATDMLHVLVPAQRSVAERELAQRRRPLARKAGAQ